MASLCRIEKGLDTALSQSAQLANGLLCLLTPLTRHLSAVHNLYNHTLKPWECKIK